MTVRSCIVLLLTSLVSAQRTGRRATDNPASAMGWRAVDGRLWAREGVERGGSEDWCADELREAKRGGVCGMHSD